MNIPRFLALSVATLALTLVAAACSSGESPTTDATGTVVSILPTGTAIASATPDGSFVVAYSLRTREVSFVVDLPEGSEGPLFVRIFGASQWEIARSGELTRSADGSWTGSVALEEGALVRYVYDRADIDDFESLVARREAPTMGLETVWRLVNVSPELVEVHDTVASWADDRLAAGTGSVSGVVMDETTGLPVVDAEVAIAGMHTATDFEGGYRFEAVAVGEHHVTVHRAKGDYYAASKDVTVRAGSDSAVVFEATPARAVTVQIQALLPEDLPDGATLKVYGTTWQTGGHFYTAPDQPEGLRLPIARPVRGREGERVQISLDLYEGQSVTYRYTLAGVALSSEVRLDGEQTARSFIASRATRTRVDEIESFRNPDSIEVVLRVDVPDNTPAGVPIQFLMGPGHWMNEDEDGSWTTTLYGRPGEMLSYAIRLGDAVEVGADASADLTDAGRTIEVPASDVVFDIGVTDWVGLRGRSFLSEGELSEVLFRISVPRGTTDGNLTVRLEGSRGLGQLVLSSVAGDPTLYEGTAMLPAGRYTYDIWRDDDGEESVLSIAPRTFDVTFTEQSEDSWVSGWSGEVPNVRPREDRFQGGYYLPDFWSPGFAALTQSTFEVVEERGGPVALSSVWSYGQVRPEPVVEPRALLASSVATPLEAIRDQASEARRSGLPVVLAPQFNMEPTPDGDSLSGPKSQQWIDAWLGEAERLWLWNAEVADAINADILLLPGPTFHVFDQSSTFPSNASFEAFDAVLIGLVDEVRERFDGKVLIHGGQTDLEVVGAADLVGVTTFDTGHPALGPSATVEQWRAGYEALFTARLDPIHDAWDKPIFIYQLAVPSQPSANDPTGEYTQARQLEGMLQALGNRTWVVGTLSWGYLMIDAPDVAGDGVRGRLAEVVLSKHYELFNPADAAALTVG